MATLKARKYPIISLATYATNLYILFYTTVKCKQIHKICGYFKICHYTANIFIQWGMLCNSNELYICGWVRVAQSGFGAALKWPQREYVYLHCFAINRKCHWAHIMHLCIEHISHRSQNRKVLQSQSKHWVYNYIIITTMYNIVYINVRIHHNIWIPHASGVCCLQLRSKISILMPIFQIRPKITIKIEWQKHFLITNYFLHTDFFGLILLD